MQGKEIRVLIVDDDALARATIARLLERADVGVQIRVVGEAESGEEALEKVIAHRPDVVLMDIQMRNMDGITATKKIREMPHAPEVIVVTVFDANDEAIRAAEAGAAGFLLKNDDPREFARAVSNVAKGNGALSARAAKQILSFIAYEADNGNRRERERVLGLLSENELAVARLVTAGKPNAEIAAERFVSESTIKSQLASIQAKLGIANRVLVAVEITKAGLA